MDRFAFFFGFYGLILGLAVTELLNGLGALVRTGELRRLCAQTGLFALFVLLVICATWIDAWDSLRAVSLNFEGLWAPIMIAILYYLSAVVVFPRSPAEWSSLDEYFVKRRRFVASLMLAAEFLVNYTYRGVLLDIYRHNPAEFWGWEVPYNIAIKIGFIALIFVKGRRAKHRCVVRNDPAVRGAVLEALNVLFNWKRAMNIEAFFLAEFDELADVVRAGRAALVWSFHTMPAASPIR